MSRSATTRLVAHVRLSGVHTAGFKEGQDGLLGCGCLHVVLLQIWLALHKPESCMLEEVRPELVAGILGAELTCADKAAAKDLHTPRYSRRQQQTCRGQFLLASLASWHPGSCSPHMLLLHRTGARKNNSKPSCPRYRRRQHSPVGAVQQSRVMRSPHSRGEP